jgi:hypothetical protein
MTGRALASVALKVWGIFFVVGVLTSLPEMFVFLRDTVGGDPSRAAMHVQGIGMALGLGTRALMGVALFVFADRLVERVIPETRPLAIGASLEDLTRLAFTVVGIFVLVWGLQDTSSVVFALVTKPEWLSDMSRVSYAWNSQQIQAVRAAAELGAGIVLVLGRNGLATAWSALRSRSIQG